MRTISRYARVRACTCTQIVLIVFVFFVLEIDSEINNPIIDFILFRRASIVIAANVYNTTSMTSVRRKSLQKSVNRGFSQRRRYSVVDTRVRTSRACGTMTLRADFHIEQTVLREKSSVYLHHYRYVIVLYNLYPDP